MGIYIKESHVTLLSKRISKLFGTDSGFVPSISQGINSNKGLSQDKFISLSLWRKPKLRFGIRC